jgi:hypothetical protein
VGKKKQRKKALLKRNNQHIRKHMAIMVGMPIHHYVDNFTLMCIDATVVRLQEKGIPFCRVSTIGVPDVAKARNQLVDEFLKNKEYTHLMWIDSDMAWDPEAVEALIELDAPVASCLVTKKGPPFDVTLFKLMLPNENSKYMNTYFVRYGEYPMNRPFTLPNSGIGTAFMLIERKVIESMSQPYFCGFVNPADNKLKGTDFYFCIQMLKNGYEITYDPRPHVYHVGKCLFGVEDHIAYVKQYESGGTKECQFMNSGASVVDWKKSFAGPQPSLIQRDAPVAEHPDELCRFREVSKSETSSCPSSEKDDPTNPQKKIITDAVKSKKPEEDTSHQISPDKPLSTSTSVVKQ